MTKWTPPLSIDELAHAASRLARGARHIDMTCGELDAALPWDQALGLKAGSVKTVLASRPELR